MNKQDEEKAKEIAKDNPSGLFYQAHYDAALKMAQWKEEQMIQRMENFVKKLYLPAYPYKDRENSELIQDIKEAMMKGE